MSALSILSFDKNEYTVHIKLILRSAGDGRMHYVIRYFLLGVHYKNFPGIYCRPRLLMLCNSLVHSSKYDYIAVYITSLHQQNLHCKHKDSFDVWSGRETTEPRDVLEKKRRKL
jgi:hypothetical protein